MKLFGVVLVFLKVLLIFMNCKQQVTSQQLTSQTMDDLNCTVAEAGPNRNSELTPFSSDVVARCLKKILNLNSSDVAGSKRGLDLASLLTDLEKMATSRNTPPSVLRSSNEMPTVLKLKSTDPPSSLGNPDDQPSTATPDTECVNDCPNVTAASPDPSVMSVARGNVVAHSGVGPLTIEGLAPHQIPPGNLKVSFPTQILQYLTQLVSQVKKGQPGTSTLPTTGKEPCINKKAACISWAQNGECQKNPKFMIKYCRRSCSGCASCEDQRTDSCVEWAKRGECKNNRRAMELLCWKTCSNCAPCSDNHAGCVGWASRGECNKNHLFMNKNCWRSCSSCAPCQNTWGLCKDLAKNGFCEAAPAFMNTYCWRSCSSCAPCVDKNKNCEDWFKRGFCTSNPRYMDTMCWRSCSGCCTDNESQCGDWAKRGECDKNPQYMSVTCRKSCNKC